MERLLRLQESARVHPAHPTVTTPEPTGETGKDGLTNQQLSEMIDVPKSTIEKWKSALKRGELIEPRAYSNFCTEWAIGSDGLWYRRVTSDG
jgi:hypothetical protein